ncbi:MAG: methylcrotonoyl-CoA carboxylase, partial [Terriglobia bacterium]
MATLSSAIDPRSETFQANAGIYDGLLKTLRARQAWSLAGGGDRMVQRHRDRGKIPVRERIDLLIDPFSPFLELSPLAAWGLYDNAVPAAGLV